MVFGTKRSNVMEPKKLYFSAFTIIIPVPFFYNVLLV